MATNLQTRFSNYMTLQRFANHTKRSYVGAVKGLATFYKQAPDTLTNEQIQAYLLHLPEERKLAWGTVNVCLSGLICFFRGFLEWDETQFKIPPRPRDKKLPTVFK